MWGARHFRAGDGIQGHVSKKNGKVEVILTDGIIVVHREMGADPCTNTRCIASNLLEIIRRVKLCNGQVEPTRVPDVRGTDILCDCRVRLPLDGSGECDVGSLYVKGMRKANKDEHKKPSPRLPIHKSIRAMRKSNGILRLGFHYGPPRQARPAERHRECVNRRDCKECFCKQSLRPRSGKDKKQPRESPASRGATISQSQKTNHPQN